MPSEAGTLLAPPAWRLVDFISDLHLQASEPATFAAWHDYMLRSRADAIFILGDLFEAWVGDDAATEPGSFEHACANVLKQAAEMRPVFFMQGNRDFLVGQDLMRQCGATLLADPAVLDFGGTRWLLSHGDQLCLADTDYLKFRAVVRSAEWQSDFLAKPLPERRAIARDLRQQSEALKRSARAYADVVADVDAAAAATWLRDARASHLIHGHTHKPGDHSLDSGLQRIVLSDWDVSAQPPRAQVLRLSLPDAGVTQATTWHRSAWHSVQRGLGVLPNQEGAAGG